MRTLWKWVNALGRGAASEPTIKPLRVIYATRDVEKTSLKVKAKKVKPSKVTAFRKRA